MGADRARRAVIPTDAERLQSEIPELEKKQKRYDANVQALLSALPEMQQSAGMATEHMLDQPSDHVMQMLDLLQNYQLGGADMGGYVASGPAPGGHEELAGMAIPRDPDLRGPEALLRMTSAGRGQLSPEDAANSLSFNIYDEV